MLHPFLHFHRAVVTQSTLPSSLVCGGSAARAMLTSGVHHWVYDTLAKPVLLCKVSYLGPLALGQGVI